MLGIARNTLKKRIQDEQKAQQDYGKDISQTEKKGDKESARVIKHILMEEKDHESKLRKLGSH